MRRRRQKLALNAGSATAVIAAAGSGERLGAGGPKAFAELGGRPLLDHSLAALERSDAVGAVVVAAPADHLDRVGELLARSGLPGIAVGGGATRAESVRAALESVDSELVLVHDAARPLAEPALFDAIVRRLEGEPNAASAIAAVPLHDTIKRRRPGTERAHPAEVAETVPRDDLWAAQTPQGFRLAALRSAQEQASAEGRLEAATDEAGLIEAAGGRVLLEPAPSENLKVTTPADLRLAEAILAARERV